MPQQECVDINLRLTTRCCALIFLRTYPAVGLSQFTITTYSVPCRALCLPCCALRLPCCDLIYFFCSLYFDVHLPCCAITRRIFFSTLSYPAAPLFIYFFPHLFCCALILLCGYPASNMAYNCPVPCQN